MQKPLAQLLSLVLAIAGIVNVECFFSCARAAQANNPACCDHHCAHHKDTSGNAVAPIKAIVASIPAVVETTPLLIQPVPGLSAALRPLAIRTALHPRLSIPILRI